MKSGTALAATFFALASFPLFAQQPSPATPPADPSPQSNQSSPATQQDPAAAQPASQSSPAAAPQTIAMSPVNGELESKLDSKTAKTGDNVVVKTRTTIKTSDGTEIPKGSKLIGHVIAVQPSASGTNSQVALQFDHIELKGGQSLPVHSQIQSISPAGGAASTTDSSAVDAPSPAAAPATGSSNRSMGGANSAPRPAGTAETAQTNPNTSAPAANSTPAAGTVVAKNGNIAIQTTSIPGVLLANNAPGMQDPRMATASSILLGARKDIQLDGGTQMVIGISAGGQ